MTTTAQNPAQAYQQYYGPAIFEPLSAQVIPLASIQPGDAVLDIACGTGILTRHAAVWAGPTGRVVGVDVNPAMIEVARTHPSPVTPSITYEAGDATALTFPDDAFDVVLCQQGLQFFDDRPAALEGIRRVARPGARVVLAVWKGLDHHPLFRALAEAEQPHLAAVGAGVTWDDLVAPFSLGDADAVRDVFTSNGLHQVELFDRSIEARFADADRFVERLEFAYAAVVPLFTENPDAFAAYLTAIGEDTREVVAGYRQGDEVVVPMHATIAVATA
ncbi:MAG TPA: methyltransferase domain-containing protein [Egibacteraceae bacterium]|nr:methyltransferase domain-containing protein [Egibacteraceae bacterium]